MKALYIFLLSIFLQLLASLVLSRKIKVSMPDLSQRFNLNPNTSERAVTQIHLQT